MKKNRKQKKLLISLTIIIAICIVIIIAVISTRKIIDNQYTDVLEMQINDVNLEQIPDGDYYGDFSYGKNIYSSHVMIKNHFIQEINLNVETKSSNQKYVEKAKALIEEVINSQTLQVDAISGATRSSKSILKSVENALNNFTG